METDAQLVARATGGDEAAMSELYERYVDRVYDFLTRLVRDRVEAADIAQDTFVKAIGALGALASGASFKSWVFTIARNTALSRLEGAGRVRPLGAGQSAEDQTGFDVVDSSRFADPEEAHEAERLASLVWDAARALEPEQYSVLDLNARQGFSSADIADILGISKNRAPAMVNRIKKTIGEATGQPHALASPFAIIGAFEPVRLASAKRAEVSDAVLVAYRSAFPAGADLEREAGPGATSDDVAAATPSSDDISAAAPIAGWTAWSPTDALPTGVLPGELVPTEMQVEPPRRSRRPFVLLNLALILLVGGSAIAMQLVASPPSGEPPATDGQAIAGGSSDPGHSASPAGPAPSGPALVGASGDPSVSPGVAASPSGPAPAITPTPTPRPPSSTPTPRPPTPRPTAAPTPSPKPTPTPSPTPTPTPTPTPSPTPSPTPECSPALSASPDPMLFGVSASRRELTITASGCPDSVPFTISSDRRWLRAEPNSGTMPGDGELIVDVIVNRSRLPTGINIGHLFITSGASEIQVTVEATNAN